ncbi:LacI family DNA-binding transcriptional regulator [Marinobacterium sedimentorum]|uniref:LacI family DNA-binding transcriptional regulator n=1 Tax=Marinobacterium sedimentorum TaxID=2927804 RepID=UPI0020C61A2C|nr:LacI family DNA-binding transcriptional regulator [Marinobacterium sedimentorum]MCP8688825.1 LacI family DNA-binding transcriptional regulator [Marinobacterium sedimentorum]
MSNRITIAAVAQAAGLSVSTVDRVLNSRAPVKSQTAERVLQAARATGYPIGTDSTPTETHATEAYRLGFLLQSAEQPFYKELQQQLEQALRSRSLLTPGRLNSPVFAFTDDTSPNVIARQIDSLANQCDALALTCYEHPSIIQAIENAEIRGVPITALLSPLGAAPRRPYIGLDNRRAGRSVGWAVAQLGHNSGKVGIMIGHHRFVGHELRDMGFRSYCREQAPQLTVLEPMISLDNHEVAYRNTRQLLEDHTDLCALYIAGGGMEGVIRALRDSPPAQPLCVIVQELTSDSRQALIDGVITLVLATPLRQLAGDTLNQMLAALEHRDHSALPAPITTPALPFILYHAENC